jgi:hypothetical protein
VCACSALCGDWDQGESAQLDTMYDIQISVTPVRLFKQLIFLFSFLLKVQVVLISVAILLFLFSVQRFGTDKVGYSFAPILSVWFLLITVIGIYNLAVHDPTVLKAFNPMCILYYFRRNGCREVYLRSVSRVSHRTAKKFICKVERLIDEFCYSVFEVVNVFFNLSR